MSSTPKKNRLHTVLIVLLCIALALLIPLLLAEYIKDYESTQEVKKQVKEYREENIRINEINDSMYALRKVVFEDTAYAREMYGQNIENLKAKLGSAEVVSTNKNETIIAEEAEETIKITSEQQYKTDVNEASSVLSKWNEQKASLLKDFPLKADQVHLIRLFADDFAVYDTDVLQLFYEDLRVFVQTGTFKTIENDSEILDMLFKGYYVECAGFNGHEIGTSLSLARSLNSYLDSLYSFDEPRSSEDMLILEKRLLTIVEQGAN